MIVTLTMNPCIDVTETIPHFVYGGLNRITSRRADSSGKGINVAMVLHNLGADVLAIGMNYTGNGEAFSRQLAERGLTYDAVFADGAVRENIKLFDEEKAVTTEINQGGVPIRGEDLANMHARITECLRDPRVTAFIMTGSLPPGTPKDFYKSIIEEGNALGRGERQDDPVRMILDAEKEQLLLGLSAKPYMIKPNLFEFETAFLTGHALADAEGTVKDMPVPARREHLAPVIEKARELLRDGLPLLCISMGADGAMLLDEKEAWYAAPVPGGTVRSTQGAGDSLLAGILMAIDAHLPRAEQLRWGIAAAQGSIEREGTLLCTPEAFEKYKSLVEVHAL